MTSGPQPEPTTPTPRPDAPGMAPPGTPPAGGAALAVAALLFGVLGCVVPFLPFDEGGVRPFIAFPFVAAGLACGIAGCFGRRGAKALAVIGTVLSALALIVGLIMVYNQVLR